jgi:hypothetical protein
MMYCAVQRRIRQMNFHGVEKKKKKKKTNLKGLARKLP